MRKPSPQIRETIVRALDYLGNAEPSDDPDEERRDDRNLSAALDWIQGLAPLPSFE